MKVKPVIPFLFLCCLPLCVLATSSSEHAAKPLVQAKAIEVPHDKINLNTADLSLDSPIIIRRRGLIMGLTCGGGPGGDGSARTLGRLRTRTLCARVHGGRAVGPRRDLGGYSADESAAGAILITRDLPGRSQCKLDWLR